jgi:signal transduction histidine kinase
MSDTVYAVALVMLLALILVMFVGIYATLDSRRVADKKIDEEFDRLRADLGLPPVQREGSERSARA